MNVIAKNFSIAAFLMIFLVACTPKVKKENAQNKPNIIIILADDLGYSDLGCTGSEIQTPNLDRMAAEGVLFTNFYNTSRCCPSRVSLLTGQYQWDAGMGNMDTDKSDFPEYQDYINNESITIAEALKENGYQTFQGGKWHVGSKERSMWPDKRGFDQFYGTPAGGGLYFYPSLFYERPVFHNGKEVFPDSSWYYTDAMTDYAINYIKNERSEDKPFFMYLAYVAPHFPLQAKKEDIEKYKDKYLVGYDSIRNARIQKQKDLGIISSDMKVSEGVYPDWDLVKNKEEEALEMPVYAAMVDCMDQNIGRLMATLKEKGISENTAVFFISDNGAGATDFNKTPDAEIGTRYSNAAYGIWYNVSNTPYRKHKGQEHEGGIITPMIAHWPKGINKKGWRTSETAHINDFMPTCLSLAGASYPKKYNGNTLDPLDGHSFLSLLNGGKQEKSRAYYWEHQGNKAVRQGDWKLVKLIENDWELYKINEDPYELNNLIKQFPEQAESMKERYKKWAQEHGVKEWPFKG